VTQLPSTFFGDPQRSVVEAGDDLVNGLASFNRRGARAQVGAVFPGVFDRLLQCVHRRIL